MRLVLLVTVHLALCSFVVYVAVHKTAEIPQLQSVQVVDTSFVAQRQILMVQTIQLIIEIPQFVFGGRCPCLLVFHRCSRG